MVVTGAQGGRAVARVAAVAVAVHAAPGILSLLARAVRGRTSVKNLKSRLMSLVSGATRSAVVAAASCTAYLALRSRGWGRGASALVASIALVGEDAEVRSTMSLYFVTRALHSSRLVLGRAGVLPKRIPFGDSLLFALTTSQILMAFVFEPDGLPRSYRAFIARLCPIPDSAILAVRRAVSHNAALLSGEIRGTDRSCLDNDAADRKPRCRDTGEAQASRVNAFVSSSAPASAREACQDAAEPAPAEKVRPDRAPAASSSASADAPDPDAPNPIPARTSSPEQTSSVHAAGGERSPEMLRGGGEHERGPAARADLILVPCPIFHPLTRSCLAHGALTFLRSVRALIPLYAAVHAVPSLVFSGFRPKGGFVRFTLCRVAPRTLRSSSFLAALIASFMMTVCASRRLGRGARQGDPGPSAGDGHADDREARDPSACCTTTTASVRDWNRHVVFTEGLRAESLATYVAAGVVSSTSLFIEPRGRRLELALYTLPRALDGARAMLVTAGLFPTSVPGGDLAAIAASAGILMWCSEHAPECLSPLARSAITFSLGRAA